MHRTSAMAAAAPHIAVLLVLWQLVAGGGGGGERTFSENKRCADLECSKLMCRGKAIADFTGPDCRFVNFKKDELIYVYHKLSGRTSALWAGTVGTGFGYFPKDLIEIQQVYTSDELVMPTDDTDFVCFEDGTDKFDSYDVDELLSRSKIKLHKQASPSASESLPVEKPSSESEVKSEELSSKISEPPGESPHSEAEELREKALPSETKEPPEKPSSLDSKQPSISESKVDQGDQAASENSIPQDEASTADSGPTPSKETLSAHSQSEGDASLGVSGSGLKPREASTSESDKPAETPGSDSEKTDGQTPESDKPSEEVPVSAPKEQLTPSETPERESPPTTNDAHKTTLDHKLKDSQAESVARSATEENANSNSQVPESEKAKNVSISQEDFKESKNIESFTLIDEDRTVKLKTETGLTGDAVVTEDVETRQVTTEDEYEDEDVEPHEPEEEEESVEEPEEIPLLSYDEFNMKSLDQTAFENDSASTTASEAKISPSKEEVKVPADMGHATPIKQDKNILTSLGDTFFAIVSGGESTDDVTDPDGMDSEEQDDEDYDEEPNVELEDDESLYLLGMEKSKTNENKHLEPPFEDDTLFENKDGLQEEMLAVDGDKSLESEQKINITANDSMENAVNMPSADGTLLPKSSDDSVTPQTDSDLQEQHEILGVTETSESKIEADSEVTEKILDESQTPPPLEGSEVKETDTKSSGENEPNVEHSEQPQPDDLENLKLKVVKEDLLHQEALKLEDSAKQELPKLSEDLKLENTSNDQGHIEEIKLEEGVPLTSEVPEHAKSSGSVTDELPGEEENAKIQSSDTVEKAPETEDHEEPEEILQTVDDVPVQDDDTVDKSLVTSNNKNLEHEQLESTDEAEKQPKDTDRVDHVKEESTESPVSNQVIEEKTVSGIADGEEENVDGFLEDENAASARQAKEKLANSEQETKIDPDVSAKSEPDQEGKDTTTQESEDSLQLEKEEEGIGKENKEQVVVIEDLIEENNSDISDSKIEIQEEATKTETPEVDFKSEPSKEDAKEEISDQHDDKTTLEEREPLAEDLTEDTLLPKNPLEEESYFENIKALSIMREFLDEERIAQFTKFLGLDNVMRLEAMYQDMDSELKLARKDNYRLDHIDKALDQILEASESNILEFVESVLDSRETNPEEMATEKEMFDEEATLLDDVQEISYRLRHKHSTLSDSSMLAPGERKDEEKQFSDEGNPEGDKLEPEPIIKEEESTVSPPPEEEIVEPPSEPEERTFEEVKEEEVVLPTQDPSDHIPHEPKEPVFTKEDVGIDAPSVDAGEELIDSEPWYTSTLQMFSSIGGALFAAKKSLGPVASLLMSALPEDLRPGPDFYGVQWEAIIITALVGLISVLIFFWRTCLSVKSRVYQVSEKQLAEKIAALMKEKSEALEKISELEKKIKEAKDSESTTQEKSTQLQEETASLKVTIKELKNSNKQLDGKMKNLLQDLETQKSQNKRKQEMIYEGQKSIEQLKQQYELHSAELSELQIALNEVKMKEQKVRSDLRSVQEENATLKERKEQLLKEAEGWSERQRELEEQIQLQQKSHKDMEEALAYKENEIEVLTNCIMQLKQLEEDSVSAEDGNWQPAGDGELENGELPDKRKEKMKLQIKQMMDVSRVKTTLSIIEEEKSLYQRKLTDEISARHDLEEEIKQLQHDSSSLQSDKTRLDNECKTLRQKVEILTELYQQKEMALQKKLTQEEYERQEKEQKLSAADEKAILAVEEVKIYKQRIQEMEEELQKTERSFKNQIASHEKKAHENWLVARTAERTLAEEKRECANLRQKLIEVNQRVAALQRPSIVKPTPGRPEHQPPPRRGALSRDGSFGPSPVSGGAPSPPMMMDGSVRSASANLNRSEDLKGNIGGVDAPSGTRRPPHEMSGRISAPVDLGHSTSVLNSGPRTSSPSVDGLVMPIAKGPPSFPGTPVMNSPAGAPMMSQPPGRMVGPTPPRGHFGTRSLPPGQMHGPPPVPRDFPPRTLLPPGGIPLPDPRGMMRGPLPPRDYPPGPVSMHGPRDYPIPPPGARDFPPGLPPPGSRDFPPGPPLPGPRDFPPGALPPAPRDFPPGPRDFLPPPGVRDFPPGLPPPGAQEFPSGMRDFPPGPLPPGARDIPPGLPPPGSRDFPPVLPPLGSREFVPGLPPPGARFLPGPREFLPGPPPPGPRDFLPGPPPTGVRDFVPGPHPGVPAGPSLPDQRPVPPGHNPPSQTDNEQSQAHSKP